MKILLDSANRALPPTAGLYTSEVYGQGILNVEAALALGEERDLLREEVV